MKTHVLGDDETLKHRMSVHDSGGKWKCESCGFEEPGVVAWRAASGGDVRLSCHECHLYEDPLRYNGEIALAYLPLMSRRTVSHLVRIMLEMSEKKVGLELANAMTGGSVDPRVQTLLTRALSDLDESLSAAERKAKLVGRLDAGVKEMTHSARSNISFGIKTAQAMFPDKEMVLRVLADGPVDVTDELFAGLRLIPTNIRWSRRQTWHLNIVSNLRDEVIRFATEHMAEAAEADGSPKDSDTSEVDESSPVPQKMAAGVNGQ